MQVCKCHKLCDSRTACKLCRTFVYQNLASADLDDVSNGVLSMELDQLGGFALKSRTEVQCDFQWTQFLAIIYSQILPSPTFYWPVSLSVQNLKESLSSIYVRTLLFDALYDL